MKQKVILRITALLLAALLFCSCSQTGSGLPRGVLYRSGITEEEYRRQADESKDGSAPEYVFFDNLASMLLALGANRIASMTVPECVADYVCMQNDNMQCELGTGTRSLSMAVAETDTELLEALNTAISSLKEEGTIKALYSEYVEELKSDPEPVALPVIDGARTVRVVVTGDLPPLDYTTADGQPAGFNLMLLSAISERAGINFETVTAEAASRASMLTSGKADAIFWMQTDSRTNDDGSVTVISEGGEGLLLTQDYVETPPGVVTLR